MLYICHEALPCRRSRNVVGRVHSFRRAKKRHALQQPAGPQAALSKPPTTVLGVLTTTTTATDVALAVVTLLREKGHKKTRSVVGTIDRS